MKKVDLKVPNKLSEITLGQYQKFSKILLKEPENDFLQKKMIEIFCGVPLSQVNFYKYSSITNIVNVLSKMFEKTPELKQVFKMNGKEFGMIPKLDDMNFGEFVDLDTYANDWEDMDKAMNVLFRPIISKYKKDYLIEDYTGELNYNMSKMPLDVALGAVFFLHNLKKELMKHTLIYSQKELKKMISQQGHNSQKDGDGIQACINYLDQIRQNLNELKI
jgi:hypothetical protein|tara:strand:- start:11104 stop:11760 length:657 start_codon:yes stop_codon:yes gene_type:complete